MRFGFVCEHKCHKPGRGLNPWVEACPVCGCANVDYDPNEPEPQTAEELFAALDRLDAKRGKM